MRTISVNMKLCLACKSCEIHCALAHSESKDLFRALRESPEPRPRVRVNPSQRTRANPAQCKHCKYPQCIRACERNAICKDPESQLIVINREACAGCEDFACASACPFGAMLLEKDMHTTLFCDRCQELAEPACVGVCPTGVFKIV